MRRTLLVTATTLGALALSVPAASAATGGTFNAGVAVALPGVPLRVTLPNFVSVFFPGQPTFPGDPYLPGQPLFPGDPLRVGGAVSVAVQVPFVPPAACTVALPGTPTLPGDLCPPATPPVK